MMMVETKMIAEELVGEKLSDSDYILKIETM